MERYGTGQTDKCAHSPEIGRKVGYHKVLCVSALVNAISIVAIAKANHHQNRLLNVHWNLLNHRTCQAKLVVPPPNMFFN
nr:hypothetical protein Q903MT_gene3567 [Picea sitchensis]